MPCAETNAALESALRRWRAATTDAARDRAYRDAETAARGILVGSARPYVSARHDLDDLVQAGRMGLWRGLQSFQEGRGASVATHLTTCVERAVISATRRGRTAPVAASLDAYMDDWDLDLTAADGEGGFAERADNVAARVDELAHEGNVDALLDLLRSPVQRDVMRLRYVDGIETFPDIAAALGIGVKQAENAHTAAVRALRSRAAQGLVGVEDGLRVDDG